MNKIIFIIFSISISALASNKICSRTYEVFPDIQSMDIRQFAIQKVIVEKSSRKLHLISGDKLLKSYRVGLGKKPTGQKSCENDQKTPEGVYFVAYKNMKSDYHLSLEISYPNQGDIERAKKLGCDPGGQIMIHGLPNEWWKKIFVKHPSDWTKGCVAVNDNEIEEIFDLVTTLTPIEICK